MQTLGVRTHGTDCNHIEYIFSVSIQDISKIRTKVKFFIFKNL